MKVYVQSRGRSQDLDYRWLEEVPQVLKDSRVTNLVRPNSRSIVLTRYKGDLLLLVLGMESRRKDFRGRPIRNSVLWVSENEMEEQQLRAIAISALKDRSNSTNKLASKVDEVVQFDDVKGFCFNTQDEQNQLDRIGIDNQLKNEQPSLQCQIAKLSSDRIGDLIEDLERGLPAGDRPLVVVTDNRSEDALREARVWRGLSNSVKSEDWEPIVDEELRKQVFFPIALLMMLVVTVLITILVTKQINKEKPTITPEPQTINPTLELPMTCKEMIDPETQEVLPPCLPAL